MITVHHLDNSRSQRVLWMLEELGLPYEIILYQRDADTQLAPASLKRVHPLGKAPVLTDGAITMAESGAIIDYLAQHYGRETLLPAVGTPAYREYVYWLHYAEGSLMPPLLVRYIFEQIRAAPMPFFVRFIINRLVAQVNRRFLDNQLHSHLGFVADHLACHEWFAGDSFSAADIQMSFPLEVAMTRANAADSYPRLKAYVDNLQVRPAYQKALAAGGPYRYGSGRPPVD
ncbi:glutathione S-transferase [Zobellella aerophila]|uniref:Glutathione S-transferase n=1 Tax=Zobellella aerophila TaxID=870480 RepID=A0ABP6W9T9_9GAMM